jgi:hypothetical protein
LQFVLGAAGGGESTKCCIEQRVRSFPQAKIQPVTEPRAEVIQHAAIKGGQLKQKQGATHEDGELHPFMRELLNGPEKEWPKAKTAGDILKWFLALNDAMKVLDDLGWGRSTGGYQIPAGMIQQLSAILHRLQICNGPSRSPADLFVFDMLVHGLRGAQLPGDEMSLEELEVYGVDWEGLHEERLLQSHGQNNDVGEGWTSWVGRVGPPDHLNEVALESPNASLSPHEVQHLDAIIHSNIDGVQDADIVNLWSQGLAYARSIYGNQF